MNELQVKTVEIIPAKIEFNFDEIEKELDTSLERYQNLTFTESATTEIRKVLSDLQKGKEAVNRYRIDTKKELNKPVVTFEDKCKELSGKFDDVIDPLDKQLKEYVQRERDEKRIKCEEIRDKLIKGYELEEDYASQVDILDQYLTKSRSLKQVEESIEFQVKNLKAEQEQAAANIEIIKTNVKLANAEHDLSLSVDAYVRLLESSNVESVKKIIKNDASNEVARRKKTARLEELKKQKELEKQSALLEKQKKLKEVESEQQFVDEHEVKGTISVSNIEAQTSTLDDLPFGNIGGDEKRNVTLGLILTVDQLEELKVHMDYNNIIWEVHADEDV